MDPKREQSSEIYSGQGPDRRAADQHICCCSHGSRCTCALKKEHHLDTVPEDICETPSPISYDSPRPRPNTTQSDGKLSIVTNGHIRPIHHKHNDMAHKCGIPYTRVRPHSIHGHAEVAQRSVDSLPLTKRALLNHETPHHHDSITSAPQSMRRAKSEHGSPELNAIATPDYLPHLSALPNLDSPLGAGSPASLPLPSSDSHLDSYFTTPDQEVEPPLHSAGVTGQPIDWSTYALPCNQGGAYSTAPSQPPSYASLDWNSHLSHPGLTSSSGDLSEVGDYPHVIQDNSQGPADNVSDFDVEIERDQYRLSGVSDLTGVPIPASSAMNTENLDIDDFLKSAEEETKAMQQRNLEMRNSMSSSPMSSTDVINQTGSSFVDYPVTSATSMPGSMSNSGTRSPDTVPPPPGIISSEFSSPLQQQQFPSPVQDQSQTSSLGPKHGLTVREAQKYAHMGSTDAGQPIKGEAFIQPTVTNSAEDPMWSYTATTPSSMSMVDTEAEY